MCNICHSLVPDTNTKVYLSLSVYTYMKESCKLALRAYRFTEECNKNSLWAVGGVE